MVQALKALCDINVVITDPLSIGVTEQGARGGSRFLRDMSIAEDLA